MELGSWGPERVVVPGQGPLTARLDPFVRPLRGNGEHCLRHKLWEGLTKTGSLEPSFCLILGSCLQTCLAPLLARILLIQFSKNPPTPCYLSDQISHPSPQISDPPGQPSARILLCWFSKDHPTFNLSS